MEAQFKCMKAQFKRMKAQLKCMKVYEKNESPIQAFESWSEKCKLNSGAWKLARKIKALFKSMNVGVKCESSTREHENFWCMKCGVKSERSIQAGSYFVGNKLAVNIYTQEMQNINAWIIIITISNPTGNNNKKLQYFYTQMQMSEKRALKANKHIYKSTHTLHAQQLTHTTAHTCKHSVSTSDKQQDEKVIGESTIDKA